MTIKSKAAIGTVFSLLVMGGVIGLYSVTSLRLKRAEATEAALRRIVRGAFDLDSLTWEYIVYESPRVANQWVLKHADLGSEIAGVDAATRDEEAILAQLSDLHSETRKIFRDLGEVPEARRMGMAPTSLYTETAQRLAGQLGTELQAIISLSSQLSNAARDRERLLMNAQSRIVFVCVTALVLALGGGSALTVSTIVRPLRRLRHDIRIIGKGDLQYRTEAVREDEIGELAQAFNAMTADLREITASRDELNAEIEQRIRAEEKLQRTLANLERSNSELEQFAYVASHDLQEPLRKISAFGDRLRTKGGDVLNDQCRDYLDRMLNATGRMQMLINDLLSFSRVTTRARPFVKTDLNKIVRDVISDLEARTRDTGGSVEVDGLPVLDADPMQMRQLFQNLIGNGLKYHRQGVPPVVSVKGALVKTGAHGAAGPGGRRNGEVAEIAFSDNGIGFDEKYKDQIFGVFQRLHGRSEYEGTGIGLAICRKIVDRHCGKIDVRSAPDEGTTFIVRVPVTQVQREDSTEGSDAPIEQSGPARIDGM